VVATLRVKFAACVTIGVTVGGIAHNMAETHLEPVIMELTPVDYKKWVAPSVKYGCKLAGGARASSDCLLTRYRYTFHSSSSSDCLHVRLPPGRWGSGPRCHPPPPPLIVFHLAPVAVVAVRSQCTGTQSSLGLTGRCDGGVDAAGDHERVPQLGARRAAVRARRPGVRRAPRVPAGKDLLPNITPLCLIVCSCRDRVPFQLNLTV